jgi:flagellar hook-associated protein 2
MSINIDGIVSGFDTTGLINAVLAAQAIPVDRMRDQVTELEDKREKIAGLSNRLTDFAEKLGSLRENALRSYTPTSSSEVLTPTATAEAAPGTYRVRVQEIGRGEVSRSQRYDSTGLGTLGRGTLSITYQGETTEIVVDETNDGLTELAKTINEEVDGLQAYVLDTGNTNNPYRLVVKGEIGASNTIEFDSSGLSGSPSRISFTERLDARSTRAQVDNETVFSDSTAIEAIPGLTIEATDTTGWETITVEEDLETTTATLQELVDAYNEVRSYYDQNTVFNDESGIKGALVGESGARRVMDSLSTMVTQQYANDGAFEALSQLGISTERDGKLSLDTEAFQEAWTENRADVEALFFSETGPLAAIQTRIEDVFVNPEDGTLASRTDSIQGSIEDLEDTIARKEDFLSSYAQRLRDQFTAMESVLAQSQSTSAYLAALTVQSGGGGGGLF